MTNSNTAPAILITIPLSHYCEKARWALDRVALPYREEPHAPLLHRLATKRNERGTVPVLVHAGSRYSDSTDILKHVDIVCGGDLLFPRDVDLRREVEELEERFDKELGPHTRRWAYGQALPQTTSMRSLWSRDVPPLEASVIQVITPMVRRLVRMATRSRRRTRSVHSSACAACFEKWTNCLAMDAAFWSASDSPPPI